MQNRAEETRPWAIIIIILPDMAQALKRDRPGYHESHVGYRGVCYQGLEISLGEAD